MIEVLVSLWRWRRLVRDLAARELRARYAGSVLGSLWAVVEPGVQFALYFVVFSYFLGMRLEGRPGMEDFALYLVSGLVPFMALQESLMASTGLARAQAGLVRHVNVPIEVLLAGGLVAIMTRHAISLALVVGAAVAYGRVVLANAPLLLAGMALLALTVWGAGLLLVVAGAFLPDLLQVVGTGTTMLFFLTPIVYPASMIPEALAGWLILNPLVGLIDLFRAALMGGPVVPARLATTAAVSLTLLLLGGVVFRQRARAVRDVV